VDLIEWLRELWSGILVTIELFGASMVLTTVVAILLALCRASPSRTLRVVAQVETDLFRSIPLLVMLLFLYYAVAPHLAALGESTFWVAVVALTLSESAYLAEIYRAAFEAIPAQQWDAAASIGLSWWQTMRLVMLPQAIPAGIPGTVNIGIGVIKDSSLTSLIAVPDVTLGATIVVSNTFLPFQVYLVLAGIYFVMVVPLAYLARYSERMIAQRIGLRAATKVLAEARAH
jgi:His/Glu/Gln/Arg/opine family amino acid ABC transporter permease subunit